MDFLSSTRTANFAPFYKAIMKQEKLEKKRERKIKKPQGRKGKKKHEMIPSLFLSVLLPLEAMLISLVVMMLLSLDMCIHRAFRSL
jgi:hypothetical protein